MLDRQIKRRPNWIRHKLPSGKNFFSVENDLKKRGLYTVCQEAKCPNISECWEQKTATMMILGDTCTRACKFCNVKTGDPKGFINFEEIEKASEMVQLMGLEYLVVTSVDRDDLDDFGSTHFSNVVKRIKRDHPNTKVEVLVPDFNANPQYMKILADSGPFVIAQNIETVKRLTHPVRDRRASYNKTLEALKFYKEYYPTISTKTSIMLGFGENEHEILQTMDDLVNIKVDILTLGQYLQPSKAHLAVQKFYHPNEFERFKDIALKKGFKFVASGPMVRSSYKAKDYFDFINEKN